MSCKAQQASAVTDCTVLGISFLTWLYIGRGSPKAQLPEVSRINGHLRFSPKLPFLTT